MKLRKLIKKVSLPTTVALMFTITLSNCGTTAEGIGSIGGTSLHFDSKERQILGQARAVGTLVGAGAGYMIAKNNKKNRLGGALAGAAAGGLIGDIIGRGQATKARNARLNNDQLRALIASAKANNRKIAAYNKQTKTRIAKIRAAAPSERSKLAKIERKKADKALADIDALNKKRRADAVKLAPSQRSQYLAVTKQSERERATLAASRNTLVKIENQSL